MARAVFVQWRSVGRDCHLVATTEGAIRPPAARTSRGPSSTSSRPCLNCFNAYFAARSLMLS
jgi:hypothetical protein